MRHAVILAHPKPTSFCAALAEVYAAEARAGGHAVILRDLYALDFDPRLRASELPSPAGYAPHSDVVHERELLRDVDVICFVYPFWFNAPPAMLKGYMDRVLSMDFGYQFRGANTVPALTGRRLFSVSTSGAPDHWVAETGVLNSLIAQMDLHLAAMTGMTVADHLHFGAIQNDLSAKDAEAIFEAVRQAVRRLTDEYA